MSSSLRTALISFGLGILIGLGVMGWLRRPQPVKAPKADVAAPQVNLPDGHVKVEVAQPVKVLPKPRGLGKDETVIRHVELTVEPDKPIEPPEDRGSVLQPLTPPEPVKLFFDLVRQADGHIRVMVYVQGGKLLDSIDIPVESMPIIVPKPGKTVPDYKWTVTAERVLPVNTSLSPTWGAQVLYRHGPFVGGIGGNRYEGRLILGMSF